MSNLFNKLMDTVPRVIGTVVDVAQSVLKGGGKPQPQRRPAVRPAAPAPAASATQSANDAAEAAGCPFMSGAAEAPEKSAAADAAASEAASTTAPPMKAAPQGKAEEAVVETVAKVAAKAPAAAKASKSTKEAAVDIYAPLDGLNRKEVYAIATALSIPRRKNMKKAALIDAIEAAREN